MLSMSCSAILNILTISKKKSYSQSELFSDLYGNFNGSSNAFDDSPKTVNNYRHGNPIASNALKNIQDADLDILAEHYKKDLLSNIQEKYKRNIALALRYVLSIDPINDDTLISKEHNKKKGHLIKGTHFCLHYYIAILMKYAVCNDNTDTYADINEEFIDGFNKDASIVELDDNPIITSTELSLMDSSIFQESFVKIPHSESINVTSPSRLEIYHLKLINTDYDYIQVSKFLVQSIQNFIFSRRQVQDAYDKKELNHQITQAFMKFIKLKPEDSFPNIMLYSFLECALKAPKILSSYELTQTPGEYKSCSSGVHLLPAISIGAKNNQLVFGSSKVEANLKDAIDDTFSQVEKIIENKNDEIKFVDENIFRYCFEDKDATYLKELLIPGYSGTTPEMSFGLFISFNINIKDKDKMNQETYNLVLTKTLQKQVSEITPYIQNKIDSLKLNGYSFYLYLLPLEDVNNDQTKIYDALEE